MNCDIVKDLIPLYIDGCCSEESRKAVEEHIKSCAGCKELLEDMMLPSQTCCVPDAPKTFYRLRDWKASVLQSVLLFVSFSLITVGVALEAQTPSGLMNGFWARNLVIPATGFMLSLANWYFVRFYKSRRRFSGTSLAATLGITLCAYLWSMFHYETNLPDLFAGKDFAGILEMIYASVLINRIGIILTALFCALSGILSGRYGAMLGKE